MLAACGEDESAIADMETALALATKHHMEPLLANCHNELARLAAKQRRGDALALHRSEGEALFRRLGLIAQAERLSALT